MTMGLPTILETIVAEKQVHVANRKQQRPMSLLQGVALPEPPRGFCDAIGKDLARGKSAVIAE
ncbi:MAG: indole-3-glycerol-phosphate synthase TrpC, partial [Gammaproteobacteria bacterium]|nr:indole-3-glycerol-phosphate synthase TrpC [Gammaproteobacteria bacterium]